MPNPKCPVLDLSKLVALGERPFPSCPQVSRYFAASAVEEARKRLARAIERGDGPGLIIGAPGTGKSLLLQVLAAQFHERFDIALLACARICTRRALLQAILFELGLPYRSRDEGELRLSLLDQLFSGETGSHGLLLLVDEAQSLSAALLDELRVLTNVVRGGSPRVRLVIAGSCALEESFANPELESFSQRVAARNYLAPFTRQETAQYIRAQIAASGASPDQIFIAEALNAVFDATDGAPRLINQLCDRAMLIAEGEGRRQVDPAIVQVAWSDLQQLPSTWAAPPIRDTENECPPSSPTIEFGQLEALRSSHAVQVDQQAPDREGAEVDNHGEAAEVSRKQEPAVANKSEMRRHDSADNNPFAEEFDEEEVVLDNFAAWDDVISGSTPRVENLRDGGFSTRVRDAMLAIDSADTCSNATQDIAIVREEREPSESDGDRDPTTLEAAADDSDSNWPPIRLAVVTESPRLTPIPLLTASDELAVTVGAAFDPVMPEEDEIHSATLLTTPTSREIDRPASMTKTTIHASAPFRSRPYKEVDDRVSFSSASDPILVIESDADELPSTQGPVRRENYRNLFSRLRSG